MMATLDSSGVNAEQLARVLSEAMAPWVLNIGFFVVLGAHTSSWTPALVAAVGTGVVPMLLILVLMRMGRVGNHHVTARSQRSLVYLGILICVVGLIAVLAWLDTARLIWVGVLSALVFLVVFGLLALKIKASVHVGLWVCLIVFLGLAVGPWWFAGLLLTPVTAWARIRIRHHTIPEITAGAVAGIVVTTICYLGFLV